MCRAAWPLCTAIAAGVWGALKAPQKPEGSRCSEMHSQPYLSPKWIIPDGNSSCFEKTIYPFTFSWCAGLTVAHCHCGRGSGPWGLGAAQGPQKPEGSRCSEMHSQPYLRRFFLVCRAVWPEPNYFFSWNQSTIIFFKEFQGTIIFFKEYQGTIIFFNSIHAPPPPPPGYLMVNALEPIVSTVSEREIYTEALS